MIDFTSHRIVPTSRRPGILAAVVVAALVASLHGAPAAAAPLPADPSALVIHGGDRTLAAVPAPAGPAELNLAKLGAFPNEIVVRGTNAYVVCSGADAIHVIDLLTGNVVRTIATGAGSNPYGLAFLDDTRLYVSRFAMNDVVAIDLPGGTVAATIPVGRSPEGVAVAAGRVFVANSGFDFSTFGYDRGTVSVIDPATNGVTATLPVGLNPQALAPAPNGELHVVCTGDYFSVFGRAFVIDPAAPAVVDSVEIGASPGNIAVSPSGAVYLGDYVIGLLKYDGASRTLLRDALNPISLGLGAGGVDFDGNETWVCLYGDDAVVTLDGNDDVIRAISVGDGPQDLAFYTPARPVPVTLLDQRGRVEAGHAWLGWRTAEEGDAAGFLVDRATQPDGPWDRRTPRLLAARPDGRYEWRDDAPIGDASTSWYRLSAIDRDGRTETFAPLALTRGDIGGGLRVDAPTPNPLRGGRLTVTFELARPGPVEVALFDAAGRAVRRLLDAPLSGGAHALEWDGRDDDGRGVAQGLYLLRVVTPGSRETRRVMVLGRRSAGE